MPCRAPGAAGRMHGMLFDPVLQNDWHVAAASAELTQRAVLGELGVRIGTA